MTIAIFVNGKENIVMATDSCLTIDETQDKYFNNMQKTFLLPSPFNIGISVSGASNLRFGLGVDKFINRFFKYCLKNEHEFSGLDDIAKYFIKKIRSIKESAGELHFLMAGYVSVDGMNKSKVWRLSAASSTDDDFCYGPGISCIGECAVLKRIHTSSIARNHLPEHGDLRCFSIPVNEYTCDDARQFCNRVIQLTEAKHKNVSRPIHMLFINPTSANWIMPPAIDLSLTNIW
jgi:hypothetical protein